MEFDGFGGSLLPRGPPPWIENRSQPASTTGDSPSNMSTWDPGSVESGQRAASTVNGSAAPPLWTAAILRRRVNAAPGSIVTWRWLITQIPQA